MQGEQDGNVTMRPATVGRPARPSQLYANTNDLEQDGATV
jgi:hypothetical protein